MIASPLPWLRVFRRQPSSVLGRPLGLFAIALILLAKPVLQAQTSFFTPPPDPCTGGAQFEADFSRGGKPDLLCSSGTIFLGNGDGTFTTGTTVTGTPLGVADFNGDGIPDILEQGTGALIVLLGKGDGTFQAPISTANGASLSLLATGDLNGDGNADVVGIFNAALMVYISKGDGTFASPVSYSVPIPSGGIVTSLLLGDVNGDGHADVVTTTVGDVTAGQVVVFLGNGNGTLQTTPKTSRGVYVATGPLSGALLGNFNGDTKLDLAVNVAPICNGTCSGTNNVSLLLGNGDGTFQAPTAVIQENGPLAAADLNGDGKLDLVVQADAGAVQVFLGNGDGTFSNASDYVLGLSAGVAFGTVTIADFNLDGKLDIAAGQSMLLGNGNGTFQGIRYGPLPALSDAAIVGRFDNGGTAPGVAVITSQQIGTTYYYKLNVFSNDGRGELTLAQTYALQNWGSGIATTDLNGDGNLDLIIVGADINSKVNYSVLLGKGDGSFQTPLFTQLSIQADPASISIVVADFSNDHKPDVAIASSQALAVLLGNGDGTFAAPVQYYDNGASYLMAGDFNSDGNLDIAAGIVASGSATALLYGNGNGTFQPAVLPSSLSNFAAHFTADFNADGKPDLLSETAVALSNGDGTFTVLPSFYNCSSTSTCRAIAVGDLNGDARPDILVTENNAAGTVYPPQSEFLLGNGDGTFGMLINAPEHALFQQIAGITDMNGDGRADIVFSWPSSSLPGEPTVDGVGVLINSTPTVAADFAINLASGSSTSQTVSAGENAKFNLELAQLGTFVGMVNLNCDVSPVQTPALTCMLSNSSVKINFNGAQPVTVTVVTVKSGMTSTGQTFQLPPTWMPLAWTLILTGALSLAVKKRKFLPILAAPMVLLLIASVSCGGGSSNPPPPRGGTSPGTYTAAVAASSGGVTHTMNLTVVVQ